LPDGAPAGFVREALYQTAALRYGEQLLFDHPELPPPYVRAHLGACTLTAIDGSFRLHLYPHVKIFDTGVIVVELRLISPEGPIEGREFVERFVNASWGTYTSLMVPPSVASWAGLAVATEAELRWYGRPRFLRRLRQYEAAVKRRIYAEQQPDFVFLQAPLRAATAEQFDELVSESIRDFASRGALDPRGERSTGEQQANSRVLVRARRFRRTYEGFLEMESDTLQELGLLLLETSAHVALAGGRVRRSLLALLLAGPRRRAVLGGDWSGRPHVHLVRFAKQADSAAENQRRFGDAFGAIVTRTPAVADAGGAKYLPSSSRPFDDYGAYLTQSATLWVYTHASVASANTLPWKDANRGHIIYEHQVKAELLEYGYALHRRLAEQARDTTATTEQLLTTERDLAAFEWATHDASRFGEIKDLLVSGWAAAGVPRIRELVSEGLRIRREEETNRNSKRINRGTALLAAAAGILAVPPLADTVFEPLWAWRRWPLPADANLAKLILVGIATGVVAIVLGLAYWAVTRSTSAE
jgi:hypothetical protein